MSHSSAMNARRKWCNCVFWLYYEMLCWKKKMGREKGSTYSANMFSLNSPKRYFLGQAYFNHQTILLRSKLLTYLQCLRLHKVQNSIPTVTWHITKKCSIPKFGFFNQSRVFMVHFQQHCMVWLESEDLIPKNGIVIVPSKYEGHVIPLIHLFHT